MCGTDKEGGHRATLQADRPNSSKCNPINNAAYPHCECKFSYIPAV